jgi:DNA-directed RNA polymerase specialized sigma24 family protein
VSAATARRARTALPALDDAGLRRRLLDALQHCAPRERMMLALLLVERLTPAEAARALRVTEASIVRRYRALLSELARAYHGLGSRRAARAAAGVARLRRAS